jgi:hydrogenase nickel incorporation protein HypB
MDIKVLKNVMAANDNLAQQHRRQLDERGIFCVNVMASPGAGKTSLILQAIRRLKGRLRIGVIEGDVSSRVDADKVEKEGIPAVQINTGGGCHLDANLMTEAYAGLPLDKLDLIFVENVGNLICTVNYDIGEHRKLVVASVAEGDDKPIKYPGMFHVVHLVVLNKIDLVEHVEFDRPAFEEAVRALNSDVEILPVSCRTGQGIEAWCRWLEEQVRARRP